jgi:hypothetical protein
VVTVAFDATTAAAALQQVSLVDLTPYLAKPVSGGTPMPAIYTSQYTGTVSWSPAGGLFAAGTAYTATITMTPAAGYTFTGVAANSFDHDGASSVVYDADSNVVTIAFDAKDNFLISGPIELSLNLPAPAAGAYPETDLYVTYGTPFNGTVEWKKGDAPHVGAFAANTAYTAMVTLIPATGYTFDSGVGPVTHIKSDGIPEFAADGENLTVTINFKKTPATMIGYGIDLRPYTPKAGEKKVTDFVVPLLGYYGHIIWQNNAQNAPENETDSDPFQPGGIYMATISLIPFSGYVFDPDIYGDYRGPSSHTDSIRRPSDAILIDFNISHTGVLVIMLGFPKLPELPAP